MAVLQPLYFAGGRYTASIDRKLITALIDPEGNGGRIGGVVPPLTSMQVTANNAGSDTRVNIATGFCIIPDVSTPSAESPGLHLCAIDSQSEFVTLATADGTTRTDLIYASVDENYYTIIAKSSNGTNATLTTSANHGFRVGQTVVISGVDDFYDGSYVLIAGTTDSTIVYARAGTYTAPANSGLGTTVSAYVEYANVSTGVVNQNKVTNMLVAANLVTLTTNGAHGLGVGASVKVVGVSSELDGVYETAFGTTGSTITYAKVATAVASVGVTTSFVARARVPFAIKVAVGVGGSTVPSLPAGTNLALASVLVSGSAVSTDAGSVKDLRKFTTGLGGVHLYNSNIPGESVDPAGVQGHLRYDTFANKLDIYDTSGTPGWRTLFRADTGHHDVVSVDGSDDALHHRLGITATRAAKGNHVHSIGGRYGLDYGKDFHAVVTANSTIPSRNGAAPTVIRSSNAVNISAGTTVLVIATAYVSVAATSTQCFFGIRGQGSLPIGARLGSIDGTYNITCVRYYTYGSAANGQVFEFVGWRDTTASASGSDVYTILDHSLTVIPFTVLSASAST
jgi:hypothetical protein